MGYGNWEDGECCFDLVLVTDKAIKVQCVVWLSNNLSKSETAYSNITPAVLPKIQLRSEFKIDDNDTIAVFAGEESKLTCTVAGARPKPAVLWKIGERQITEGITTNSTTDKDGLVTIVETLHYTFAPSDHGQTVRCITAGSWIDVEQDDYQASGLLNVMFFPQPQGTQYRLVDGQMRYIAVYFAANPSPTRAWWTLEEDGRIDVPTKLANFSPTDKSSNYKAYPFNRVNSNQTTYEARLRLKTITKQQADMVYRLSVESILLNQSYLQEYTVHISVDAAPLSDSNEASGTIAIIVVMIVLVVIVTVIVYACKTGRWCFAGSPDCTVTGTGSRVEEENPGDLCMQNLPFAN